MQGLRSRDFLQRLPCRGKPLVLGNVRSTSLAVKWHRASVVPQASAAQHVGGWGDQGDEGAASWREEPPRLMLSGEDDQTWGPGTNGAPSGSNGHDSNGWPPNLRDYQERALQNVLEAFELGITRQLISMPTGSGKTLTFCTLLRRLGRKALILTNREELVGQTVWAVMRVWPEASVGVVQGERNTWQRDVVVATVQTACNPPRLEKLKSAGFQVIIVDEAHHSTASSYLTVMDELGFLSNDPEKLLLGVTATPYRRDRSSLGEVYEHMAFRVTVGDLIERNYLCKVVAERIMTHQDLRDVKLGPGEGGSSSSSGGSKRLSPEEAMASGADFNEEELSELINTPARNDLIVRAYQARCAGRKAIAFCVTIEHAADLAEAFNSAGIPAAALHSRMTRGERLQTLAAHKDGALQVLTNVGILTEGYDDTSISAVLMARPTLSTGLYTQCVGRGLRVHPGKRDCIVLDFTDNVHVLDKQPELVNFKEVAGEEGMGSGTMALVGYRKKQRRAGSASTDEAEEGEGEAEEGEEGAWEEGLIWEEDGTEGEGQIRRSRRSRSATRSPGTRSRQGQPRLRRTLQGGELELFNKQQYGWVSHQGAWYLCVGAGEKGFVRLEPEWEWYDPESGEEVPTLPPTHYRLLFAEDPIRGPWIVPESETAGAVFPPVFSDDEEGAITSLAPGEMPDTRALRELIKAAERELGYLLEEGAWDNYVELTLADLRLCRLDLKGWHQVMASDRQYTRLSQLGGTQYSVDLGAQLALGVPERGLTLGQASDLIRLYTLQMVAEYQQERLQAEFESTTKMLLTSEGAMGGSDTGSPPRESSPSPTASPVAAAAGTSPGTGAAPAAAGAAGGSKKGLALYVAEQAAVPWWAEAAAAAATASSAAQGAGQAAAGAGAGSSNSGNGNGASQGAGSSRSHGSSNGSGNGGRRRGPAEERLQMHLEDLISEAREVVADVAPLLSSRF